MRYTNPPRFLFQPPEKRIARLAKRHGLKEMTQADIDFVLDAYNVGKGIEVKDFDSYDPVLQQEAGEHIVKATCPCCPPRDNSRQFLNQQAEMHSLLSQINMNDIPGRDMLTKALRLLKYVKELQEAEKFYDLLMQLQMALVFVYGMDGDAMSMFVSMQPGLDPGESAEEMAMQLALRNDLILNELIRVTQQLDEISELNQRHTETLADPNGEDFRIRPIEDYGEITKAGQLVWTMPPRLRNYKALTGQLDVREVITHKDKKQIIYILLDVSDSMTWNNGASIGRAAGVLMHWLKGVAEGHVEVFLRCFDSRAQNREYRIASKQDAFEMMDKVTQPAFYSGGGTNFVQPLQIAGARVKELTADGIFLNPEIVIITDGQATVPLLSDLEGTKLHSVQVGDEEGQSLSNLAIASGGISLFVGNQ